MPTPRQHSSPAERQKAYRARQEAARLAALEAKSLPPAPAIPTMPGEKRWAALNAQARAALEAIQGEMQGYFDARSEAWQEGEKGEAFQERLDRLDALLNEWDDI